MLQKTMRAIQAVCMRSCHTFAFTMGLSFFNLVQTQAPSLTVALMDRLCPLTHRNNKRLDRGNRGGAAGSKNGRGSYWARWQNFCYLRYATLTEGIYHGNFFLKKFRLASHFMSHHQSLDYPFLRTHVRIW